MQETISYVDQILIFVILGLGANLVVGYAGVLQVAPAAFGAFGGYSVVYMTSHGQSWWFAVVVGIAMATVVGFLVGMIALNLDHIWVLLLTLSAGLLIEAMLSGLQPLGGINGLQATEPFTLFGYELGEPTAVLPLIIVVAVVVLAVCWRIGESPYGRVLRGIRADESAVYSLGKNAYAYKLALFALSSALFGLGGAMLGTLSQVASSTQFGFTASIEIIAIIIIGGLANPFGTLVGSVVIVLLVPFFEVVINLEPQVAANAQLVAYGLVLTLVVFFFPSGAVPDGFTLSGGIRRLRERNAGRAKEQPAGPASDTTERRRVQAATRAGDCVSKPPAAAQGVVLEVQDVSKSFAGIKAVDGLSMQLQGGTITALVGANGAGKTTVFNLLTGALPLDSGQVFLNGQNITGLRPDQVAHLGMVRSFQDLRLFSAMTVLDNVLMGVRDQPGEHLGPLLARPGLTRRGARDARTIADRWLEFVGMQDVARRPVDLLGYGQQKLVALARILATEAPVLLLDEPASGIDYQFLDEMLDVVTQLRDEGRTVCIVEHNLDVVGRLADHVYFMELGKITAEGAFTDLTSDPRLAQAYFGS